MTRRLWASAISFGLLISLQITFWPNSSNALELSSHGREALAQIAECINRDDKDTLNVLYLIDESGSLNWNDKDNIRTEALISSLKQFADASENRPYFRINRAFTTFANKFTVRKNWQQVDMNSFKSDQEWIIKEVPNLNTGSRTNWELGLVGSLDKFKEVSKASSCEILVWFTDGGLNVSDSISANADSLSRICGTNPLNGKSSASSLIDEIRQSEIWIQGILLKNYEGQRSKLTDEKIKTELSLMSYFPTVIEHKGSIDPYYFDGKSESFECGLNTGAYGLVQTVTDPVDIIWPTQQFNCLSTGGRVIEIKNSRFEVDPGITRFSVTAFSESFQLTGSDGQVIANSQGVVRGNVSSSFLNSSESVLQVTGNVSSSSGKSTSPGSWKIRSADNSKAVVCGFLDMEIQVSVSTCYAGEVCKFEGTFTQKGLEADLTKFKSKDLRAGELTSQKGSLPISQLSGSSFSGQIKPSTDASSTFLGVSLNLTTKSGIEFEVATKRPIQIIPPGIYPSVSPNPIRTSDFSSILEGKKGKATANLLIEGPSRTSGKLCLGPLEVRSDANPKRITSFEAQLDGSQLRSEKCFDLSAGESRNLELSITNPIAANGTSKGFLKASYLSPNNPEIKSKIDVQFQSKILYDSSARLSIFILLMIIGIGLPLLGLYLVNLANSKILMNNVYIATIPVITDASGGLVSLRRIQASKLDSIITQEDFVPFSAGIKKEKKVQVGQELVEGVAPKSPFGEIKSVITTGEDSVIVSSSIKSSRGLSSNKAPGSLNLSGLVYLVQSKDSNHKIKSLNQGTAVDGEIESRLVAFLSFDGDPFQQVEKLNSDIKFNAGWLNKLLELESAQTTKVKKEKIKKASKGDQNKQQDLNSNPVTDSKPQEDGWGDSPSSAETIDSEIKDDWGSSNSQSKDDDW